MSEEALVDVDCCCFDRVLLYLESEMRGRGPAHDFDHEYNLEMLTAAKKLGIAGLQELCERRLGEFKSRVRPDYIKWDEILYRNANGEVWLVIDGMCFDVTRWLPEHPGGKSIIPKQAVNRDSTVFFELYHSSLKSFMYLEQFYCGELSPSDLDKVPAASRGEPSAAFLETLRKFTHWRVKPGHAKVHKSF